MRILHTESSVGWGGQEIRILDEALGMMSRGHEVLVVCVPGSNIHREAGKRGVPVIGLPIARKNIKGVLAMRTWLDRNPVDVVNTHSSTDSWLVALACLTLRKSPPVVRTRHVSAAVSTNLPTRWLYLGATAHIATTGEALRQSLAGENGFPLDRITSVPTGIDPAKFSPADKVAARRKLGLAEELKYLGIVATLRSWKGHLYLVDAFARLNRPEWRLLVVGDGPMREPVEARVKSHALEARVIFAGQRDNPEDWLRAMDIFCLPSYANEGVPQALLQAMLTALPIVTTPVGAIPEAVENERSALIVAPRDADAIEQAVTRLIIDASLRSSLGTAARLRAEERFSREAMLNKMEAIFRKVSRLS